MKLAIHQPQPWPYLGFFEKMKAADKFVFLDNVQFVKGDYMNRNRIPMPSRNIFVPDWLTLPVNSHYGQLLNEVPIKDMNISLRKIYDRLKQVYGSTAGWKLIAPDLKKFFTEVQENTCFLSDFNKLMVVIFKDLLGIETEILGSTSQLSHLSQEATQRLIEICNHSGCDTYVAGAGAKNYMDFLAFDKAGIKVELVEFTALPYPQIHFPEFVPNLSVLDLVFNTGESCPDFIR